MSFNEWKEYKFSELMSIIGGGTPKTAIEKYWGGDIPWLSVKDFNSDDRTVYTTEKTITKLGLENSSTKILDKGDLIISARGTVGVIAQLGKPMAFNQSCYGLRANNFTTNDFLYYLLKNEIKSIQQNTHGSVFDTITKETFDKIVVRIPNDVWEQNSIVHMLSVLDDKIETNNQINETLQSISQLLFKHWFVDFEFPNEEGNPYASSGGEMVESELGMIPKGWKIEKFNKAIENIVDNRGKTPPLVENGIQLIEGFHITQGQTYPNLRINNKQKFVSVETFNSWFRSGHPRYLDILCATVGTLPKWCFMPDGVNACIAQNIVAYRTNLEVCSPYYLLNYMNTHHFVGDFNGRIVTTAQPSIKIGHMTSIKIILPNKDIIDKFSEIVQPFYDDILLNMKQNQNLFIIRDTILPKLMNGEIDVSNIELND